MDANRVLLAGTLSELDALRHTPAGVALLSFSVRHASSQIEAGFPRQVACEVPAVALGDLATQLSRRRCGDRITLAGFLASRGQRSTQLVLHATEITE